MLELIGNTPLVELKKIGKNKNARIFAKLEMLNPTGSIKDRIVNYMVEQGEQSGEIKAGATLIDASSGNTGAAIAFIAAQKGYNAVITTTEKTSREKIKIIEALGAKVHICKTTAKPDEPEHYINLAKNLSKTIDNSFMLDQYNRLTNAEAHYHTTGRELWEQLGLKIDAVVACASSGGTISGISRYLKERKQDIKSVMPDPVGSVYHKYFHERVIDKSECAPYQIEGVGKDFICKCMNFDLVDDVQKFTDDDAIQMVSRLARDEGILAGGSSGAAVATAERMINEGKIRGNVVVILPDSGMKYLSKFYM